MKRVLLSLVVLSISLLLFTQPVFSHCEIPCGIYGDEMRFDMISEHIKTIEKSMQMIKKLKEEKDINYNQLVRWVNNKEKHSQGIQSIVYQYFMTQRIKPIYEKDTKEHKKYLRQLTLLHEMLVYAMKSKQTTDIENVEKLKSLLSDFRNVYFGPESGRYIH